MGFNSHTHTQTHTEREREREIEAGPPVNRSVDVNYPPLITLMRKKNVWEVGRVCGMLERTKEKEHEFQKKKDVIKKERKEKNR